MNAPSLTRLAVWSGPRNVSTALMRAFDGRDDSIVCDEPLYAHYLEHTGLDHPMAEEIVRRHESDWKVVVEDLLRPVPDGVRVFYQKQMAHHLLPHIDRAWLERTTNVFLIREPEAMLTSLIAKLPNPTLFDTGLPQQVELFESERARSGRVPPVIDSKDVLQNPAGVLRVLCAAVELDFQESMLSWAPGLRPTDGCWAEYWYESALSSTGFAPYREKDERVPPAMMPLLDECRELYERLHPHRLRPA